MMKTVAISCFMACGCHSVWGLDVRVIDASGNPVEGAALTITGLDRQNEHALGTVSELSDARGRAGIGAFGSQFPDNCLVTIAGPGFETIQFSFEELCEESLTSCDRNQHLELTLVEASP